MDFWQWLVFYKLIEGDPTYYSSGQATEAEYAHAIDVAMGNTRVGSANRKALVDRLWASGLYQGDKSYWYTANWAGADRDNFMAASTGLGTSQPGGGTPSPPPSGGSVPSVPDPTDDDTDNDADNSGTPGPGGVAPPDVPPFDYHGAARLVAPWLPDALVGVFAEAWKEYGSADLALAAVRQDPSYDSYFPGNRRDNGSLRMSEQEYLAQRGAYSTLLLEYGLNPGIFEHNFTDLIAGDVSAAEFAQRLEASYSQIVTNFDEVRQVYSQYYGIDMSDEAIFASFLDEETGQAILERRIAVSQVGGAAAVQGYGLGEDYAGRLVNAGLTQQSALQFFGRAANELPTLQRLATRYNDPDSSVDSTEFTEFGVFQDPTQTQRFRRLRAAETSAFTEQGLPRFGDAGELTGLRQR